MAFVKQDQVLTIVRNVQTEEKDANRAEIEKWSDKYDVAERMEDEWAWNLDKGWESHECCGCVARARAQCQLY